MADEYLELPIAQDAGEYRDKADAAMVEKFPEWEPNAANIDDAILDIDASHAATVAETASTMATTLFIDSGQRLDGLAYIAAVAATITATWTAQDVNGPYDLPEGSSAGIDVGGGQLVEFETVADATVPNGSTTVSVSMVARDSGTGANGLTGAGIPTDAPGEFTAVTFTDTSIGGQDGETTAEYVDRLARFRSLRTAAPVIAADYPSFVVEEASAAARAAILDGYNPTDVPAEAYVAASYNPDDMTTWLGRSVTLSAIDSDGEALAGADKTAVDVLFNGDAATNTPGHRLANEIVNVLDPHYTTINVAVSAVAWSTFNPVDVKANIEAALAEFFSPANWGQTAFGQAPAWENTRAVTRSALETTVMSVEGVKGITGLAFSQTALAFANPGFETNTANWSVSVPATYLVSGGGTLTRVTAQFHSGAASGQLVTTATANQGAATSLAPSGGFKAGQAYGAEIWVKGNAGGEALQAFFGDNSADATLDSFTATTSWQRRTLLWVPSADRVTGYLGVRHPAASVVTYFLDDAALLTASDYSLPTTATEPIPLTRPGTMTVAVT